MAMSARRVVVTLAASLAALVSATAQAADEGYQSLDQGPPMLGVEMSPTTLSSQAANGLGMDQGILVRQVFPNTAASTMGVQPGDVVLSINGGSIGSMTDLRNEVGFNNVGDPVDVVVSRNGQRIAMRGQFQEWPANIPREPLDPAVEQRFKDWQRRHLERNQRDVQQLRAALDDFKRAAADPAAAEAMDAGPDQALAEAMSFLKALPAWKLDVRTGVDAAEIAAAPGEPAAPAPVVAQAGEAWRIAYHLDSSPNPKPE